MKKLVNRVQDDVVVTSDRNKEIKSLVQRTSVMSKSLVRDSPHLSNKNIHIYTGFLLGRLSYFGALITYSNDKKVLIGGGCLFSGG